MSDPLNTAREDRIRITSLNVLAGGIAHELNNLLTPIVLNLSMSENQLDREKGPFVDDIKHRLRESLEAAERAKALTTRLLAFGKGGQPRREPLELRKLIEQAAKSVPEDSKCKVALSLPDELWTIEADADQIEQVFCVLFENAVEAMPMGGTIRISGENLEEFVNPLTSHLKGSHVCIRIQDQGCGIDIINQERIFDPYYTTKSGGAGLGLPTAQAIARNHSGELAVKQESGEGAAFLLYLPARTAAAKASIEAPREKKLPGAETVIFGKVQGRVLVMDDEALVRSSVEAMLQAYGYEVETARHGEEALTAYQRAQEANRPIDCTLMDLMIHDGMGGKETMQRLSKVNPGAKAVVCSGYSNDPIMENFSKYGFKAALKKPFHPDELNRLIQDLIHS